MTLEDYGIRVELTATRRVASTLTFPTGTPAHVLVDLRSSIYDYPGKVAFTRCQHSAARGPSWHVSSEFANATKDRKFIERSQEHEQFIA